MLSPEFVNHPEMISRFLREAQVISMTDHPNIIKLYGEGQWEGGLYIAMEFIQGVSLRQFISLQSFSLKRTLDIILQTAYALCHLHAYGVVHRDLKPENILIDEEGCVKVIDFGIAQLHTEAEESPYTSSQLLGTPDYMSPEQKRDPLTASYPADIYSLGILTYELITGKFSRGTIHIPLLPKGLQPIIAKTLSPSLEGRYQDIVPLITDLSAYLKSESLDKEKPGEDLWREMSEIATQTETSLSPRIAPDWPHIELGLSRTPSTGLFGLYYDLLRLPDGSYTSLIAKTSKKKIDGAILIATLRGSLLALLHNPKETPSPTALFDKLNNLLIEQHLGEKFSLTLLRLDPKTEQLTFLSAGDDILLHLPQGSEEARTISSHNPLLGIAPTEVFATQDNWHMGDRLLLTSLSSEGRFDLTQALQETSLLTPQRGAEKILSDALSKQLPTEQAPSRVLLLLDRIG